MKTIPENVKAFLHHCEFERNLSGHTVKAYRLDLSRLSQFLLERRPSTPLTHVDRVLLRDYVRTLQHFKPRTQRRRLAAVKSLFAFLQREGLVEGNPAQGIHLDIRLGRTLPRTVSLSTVKQFFTHLYTESKTTSHNTGIRDIALFELMFSSGMRVSEISNLRIASVDLDRGVILVNGKGNKERLIPLCDANVKAALRRYSQGNRRSSEDFFFTNRLGRRLSEQSIRFALKRRAKAAGLAAITPHVFRHSVATLLLEQGVDLRFIQTFLGHSSIVTTTIYVHVSETSQRNILQQLHPRRLLGDFVEQSGAE